MRQDESLEQASLSLKSAERAQAIRAREIDLYGRIVEAKNRKQALERGAGDVLTELEHTLAKKGAARADDATEWAHLRALAEIRMRTELDSRCLLGGANARRGLGQTASISVLSGSEPRVPDARLG